MSNLDPHHHHQHPHPFKHPATAYPAHTSGFWSTNSSQLAMQRSSYYSHTVCPTTLVSEHQHTGSANLVRCHRSLNLVYGLPPQHANASWLYDSASPPSAAASGLTQALPMSRQLLGFMARPRPALDSDTKYYLIVLLCIAAANSVFTFVRAFSFAYGGLVAARKLHDQLLTAVISAPAKFFQVTLPGENHVLVVMPCHQMQACTRTSVYRPLWLMSTAVTCLLQVMSDCFDMFRWRFGKHHFKKVCISSRHRCIPLWLSKQHSSVHARLSAVTAVLSHKS